MIDGEGIYRLETKEVGDKKDNDAKRKLKKYYDYYINAIITITSNIVMIEEMSENTEKMHALVQCAPFFVNNAYINAWFAVVVKTYNLFCGDTSVDKFLNFVEQNRKKLFTTDHYQCWIPEDKNKLIGFEKKWEMVEREDLDMLLDRSRKKIEACKEKVEKVKAVRDKMYAHMDKQMLDKDKQHQCLGDISVSILKELAETVGEVFNSIYYYDRNTSCYWELVNCKDVQNIAYRCQWFSDHRDDVAKIRLGLPINQ